MDSAATQLVIDRLGLAAARLRNLRFLAVGPVDRELGLAELTEAIRTDPEFRTAVPYPFERRLLTVRGSPWAGAYFLPGFPDCDASARAAVREFEDLAAMAAITLGLVDVIAVLGELVRCQLLVRDWPGRMITVCGIYRDPASLQIEATARQLRFGVCESLAAFVQITEHARRDPDPNMAVLENLLSWEEILDVLKRPNSDHDRIRILNDRFAGPIVCRQGAHPIVRRDRLSAWWNRLSEILGDLQAGDDSRIASVSDVRPYGPTGAVIDEINGSRKKRRNNIP